MLKAALWKHRKALFESTHQHRDCWKNPRSSVQIWESVIIQHHPFKQQHKFYMTCILLVYFDGPRQSRKDWGLQNITIKWQSHHQWEKPPMLLTAIIQLHKRHRSSWFKSADESLSSLENVAHVTLFKLHVAFASASHFATNLPSVPLTLLLSNLLLLMPVLFFLWLLLSWCFCLSALDGCSLGTQLKLNRCRGNNDWTWTKVFLVIAGWCQLPARRLFECVAKLTNARFSSIHRDTKQVTEWSYLVFDWRKRDTVSSLMTCLPTGAVLAVLRCRGRDVCLHPRLCWLLLPDRDEQPRSRVPEAPQWNHRWLWWGETADFEVRPLLLQTNILNMQRTVSDVSIFCSSWKADHFTAG